MITKSKDLTDPVLQKKEEDIHFSKDPSVSRASAALKDTCLKRFLASNQNVLMVTTILFSVFVTAEIIGALVCVSSPSPVYHLRSHCRLQIP